MIEIRVTGDTYHYRNHLKDQRYKWNGLKKYWWKIVGEASLNHTMDELRPKLVPWRIDVELRQVDVHGNPFTNDVLRVKLAMEHPDREPVDFLAEITSHTVTTL